MRTPTRFDTSKGPRWRVRYRRNGKQTTQTFEAEAEADKFCIDLDAYGPERAEQLFYDRLAAVEAVTPALNDWVPTYLADICDANQATRDKYGRNYHQHIAPRLGTLPLGRITSEDARRLVRHLSDDKGLKDSTVANVFTVLSGAMAAAHRRGIIKADPTAETKMPKRTSHLDGEATFLTRLEYMRLRAEFDKRFLPLLDFIAGTGARWGEVAALTIRDLDLRAGTVRINKAVKQDGKVGAPKTRRSVRTVTLPPETIAALLPIVANREPNDLVFTMPRGGPLLSRTFSTRYWIPACEKAGLTDPRPTPHSLRHSHASWLIEDGIDLVQVSRRLGHASIQITVDTYGHLDPHATERQTQIAGQVFAGVLCD
jgi:integrase